MQIEVVNEELKRLVEEFLTGKDLVLVDLSFRYEGRDKVLRILADRLHGGITLDDCAYINRELGLILNEKDVIKEQYTLEVASPGLGRPLKTKNDFLRCLNRKVRVFFNEPFKGKWETEGMIKGVEGDSLCLSIQDTDEVIPLSKIQRAKQVV